MTVVAAWAVAGQADVKERDRTRVARKALLSGDALFDFMKDPFTTLCHGRVYGLPGL